MPGHALARLAIRQAATPLEVRDAGRETQRRSGGNQLAFLRPLPLPSASDRMMDRKIEIP